MKYHRRYSIFVPLLAILFGLVISLSGSAQAATVQLTVDLATDKGALYYGASGFLYGLSKDGIPSANTITPLNPQVAAQKPEGGAQHPNGDAVNVMPYYKAAGGREIQIYMQDMYSDWPYQQVEDPNDPSNKDYYIEDYGNKVNDIVDDVLASPDPDFFTYVILNEPDQIWYWQYYFDPATKQKLFDNWKEIYDIIKSKHPTARIAGPNFAHYDSTFYYDFLQWTRDNNALPDVTTWHELGDDTLTDWYNHYNDYRAHESDLGISPREISINEYARISGDLAIPGHLVQWMTRFENSKVDGSLAYWTDDGSLNNLVTPDNYNQVTGAWWLYKWYGEMTGNTVLVTPPNLNAEGLQGVASLDSSKKQARILLGGTSDDVNVVVQGFGSAPYFGSSVHAVVWETGKTGLNGLLPSTGPVFKQESDYSITGGQITIPLTGLNSSSAYYIIVTPNTDLTSANNANRYEAEYAYISGNAAVTYGGNTSYSGTYFVEGYGSVDNASTRFSVVVPTNNFYNVRLRYAAGPYGSSPATRTTRMVLNGETLTDLSFPSTTDWNTWADHDVNVFLTAGINNISFDAYTTDDEGALNIDYIEVT
ncbi:MAG: dockerin, partial [Anaerolineae bacterium]|nr:dockerin [Anaerolineae bacterium]